MAHVFAVHRFNRFGEEMTEAQLEAMFSGGKRKRGADDSDDSDDEEGGAASPDAATLAKKVRGGVYFYTTSMLIKTKGVACAVESVVCQKPAPSRAPPFRAS